MENFIFCAVKMQIFNSIASSFLSKKSECVEFT